MQDLFNDQKCEALDRLLKTILKKLAKDNLIAQEAVKIGVGGGVDTLVDIMNTEGPLHAMDRISLALHFKLLGDRV